jgi:hypothetical protein
MNAFGWPILLPDFANRRLAVLCIGLFLLSGCGRPQALPQAVTTGAVHGSGCWMTRSREPASDMTVLSAYEMIIGKDGHIALRVIGLGTGKETSAPIEKTDKWKAVEPWLVESLAGRSLKPGERAFIQATEVTFYPPPSLDK